MDNVAVATGSSDHRRRRKGSSGHIVAQLLKSPLPTPRRSCCGRSADTPAARRGRADASPQRGHVPFKWESSPGVPKSAAAAAAGNKEREVPLPKPPPGRCGACHARARAYRHSSTTDSASSDQDDGAKSETFSDALDRISSSDRLAALSWRLSAIDGVFGLRRSPSFIMDRFLPAANAIATTSADKHPRRPSPRRSKSKRDRAREAEAEAAAAARARARLVTHIRLSAHAFEQPKDSPPYQRRDAAAAAAAQVRRLPPRPRVKEVAHGDQMAMRACGLMFFVPWSAKPVLLGFHRSPARSRTPRADVASVTTASSPAHRSVTLGDVLEKERGMSHWYDQKSGSGKEWSSPGWGMALLGTSKRYCADARKALSRLTRSGVDTGDSPRIGRERRSSKRAASMLRSTSVKMPPLSPPSESWLSNARRSNAGVTKVDGACGRRESPIAHT